MILSTVPGWLLHFCVLLGSATVENGLMEHVFGLFLSEPNIRSPPLNFSWTSETQPAKACWHGTQCHSALLCVCLWAVRLQVPCCKPSPLLVCKPQPLPLCSLLNLHTRMAESQIKKSPYLHTNRLEYKIVSHKSLIRPHIYPNNNSLA